MTPIHRLYRPAAIAFFAFSVEAPCQSFRKVAIDQKLSYPPSPDGGFVQIDEDAAPVRRDG
jgi:hypothetical protein